MEDISLRIITNLPFKLGCVLAVMTRNMFTIWSPCRVCSVGSVSASRTVGREFASRPGHTKDHYKNGTNCLPAWHAMC